MSINDTISRIHHFDDLLSHHDVRAIRGMAAGLAALPTLTIYSSFDPGAGDSYDAHAVRIKHAVEGTQAPAHLLRAAELVLRNGHRPRARALFLNDRDGLLVDFADPLPVIDSTTGEAQSQWGMPLLAPLYYALSAPRYGIVYIDRERARLFETYLGSIHEQDVELRPQWPGESDVQSASKQVHPAYTPSRGGSSYDDVDARAENWHELFYRDVSNKIMLWTQKRAIDRLVIVGPREHTQLLQKLLRPTLQDRTAAILPSFPDPSIGTSAVLDRVRSTLAEDERKILERSASSLGKHRARGLDECLTATERGQVETLFVPWDTDTSVREDVLRAAASGGAHLVFLPESVREAVDPHTSREPFARLRW